MNDTVLQIIASVLMTILYFLLRRKKNKSIINPSRAKIPKTESEFITPTSSISIGEKEKEKIPAAPPSSIDSIDSSIDNMDKAFESSKNISTKEKKKISLQSSSFKEEESEEEAFSFLKGKKRIREAFIAKEILDRKYF